MRDMTIIFFRFLLVASLLFALGGALVDFAFPALIPEDFHYATAVETESLSLSPFVDVVTSLVFLSLGTLLICSYGLYTLRPWAPRLSLGLTLLTLAIGVFLGTSALSGLAFLFSSLSGYLWGAVLVLANCQPFNANFKVQAS